MVRHMSTSSRFPHGPNEIIVPRVNRSIRVRIRDAALIVIITREPAHIEIDKPLVLVMHIMDGCAFIELHVSGSALDQVHKLVVPIDGGIFSKIFAITNTHRVRCNEGSHG
jgi:hypothetical protein